MVGLPLRDLVRVAIAIGGRHGGHVHGMGGLDVAQVVADVDALPGSESGFLQGHLERIGPGLGARGGIAAVGQSHAMAKAQLLHQSAHEVFQLVGDDAPADAVGFQPGQQFGHAVEES